MSSDILGVANSTYIDYLFTANTTHSQAQLDNLANNALSRGIDFYQNGNFKQAIIEFKTSAGLAPFTDNSAKAYNYIAQSYLNLEDTDQAITTYKQAILIYPVRDDLHLALGDIYVKEGNAEEALKEYKAAVRLNPNSADNRYSLGQSYLSTGQFSEAQEQFQAVTRLLPNSASGYYGLGQVARASGDYPDAIDQLTNAISVDKKFNNSYLELGYTYADMGNVQKANEQLLILQAKESSSATTLQNYMSQVSQPQIVFALGLDGFNPYLGQATNIATMDSDLAAPKSTKLYSMNFVFSKDMDIASVQNPYNWGINRASIRQNGGIYNGGLTVPKTEANILPIPVNVTYDSDKNTASVRFRISQNADGNATLDPAHIVFKFYGKDTYGKAMDKSADEYSGFSSIA
jgi:Flp pilus assembly protein TadD